MRRQRTRPRRRPRGPGKVSGARLYRTHRSITPKRSPPTKTRRRKRKVLPPPSRGRQEKEGRLIWGGQRVQEGKDPPSGLFHNNRLQRRGVVAQGQTPGEVVSIRIL